MNNNAQSITSKKEQKLHLSICINPSTSKRVAGRIEIKNYDKDFINIDYSCEFLQDQTSIECYNNHSSKGFKVYLNGENGLLSYGEENLTERQLIIASIILEILNEITGWKTPSNSKIVKMIKKYTKEEISLFVKRTKKDISLLFNR